MLNACSMPFGSWLTWWFFNVYSRSSSHKHITLPCTMWPFDQRIQSAQIPKWWVYEITWNQEFSTSLKWYGQLLFDSYSEYLFATHNAAIVQNTAHFGLSTVHDVLISLKQPKSYFSSGCIWFLVSFLERSVWRKKNSTDDIDISLALLAAHHHQQDS
jgi:hypothetical protein